MLLKNASFVKSGIENCLLATVGTVYVTMCNFTFFTCTRTMRH